MKNFKNMKEFKEELEKLDAASSDFDGGDLQPLQKELRAMGEEQAPSPQEQRWAWTRLEARFATSRSETSFGLIRLVGWAVVALFMVWGWTTFQTDPLLEAPPVVTSTHSGIWAVPFHSKEAAADVIWVNGYDYLPASQVVQ